jgi:hypothetical protein
VKVKTRKGDRLLIWRRGVIVHAVILGKGRVEVVKARK